MENIDQVQGRVIEILPGSLFRVVLEGERSKENPKEDEKSSLAYLSGKMKIRRIRVLLGDTVLIQSDKYGGKGRIIKRL